MGEPADEARIAAIVAEGRATRRRPSRSMWIAAAIVCAICAIGFVLLLAPGDPAGAGGSPRGAPEVSPAAPRRAARGLGCAGGLGLGLAIGLAIGFVLGRRQAGARDHSSRSSP